METVYVEDSSHPNGGYICNKDEVPSGKKTITMAQYAKKQKPAESKKQNLLDDRD